LTATTGKVIDPMRQPQRQNIMNWSRGRLVRWLDEKGIAPYRAGQVLRWVYQRQSDRFSDMTDLSQALRTLLASHFTIGRLAVDQTETGMDGSVKFLWRLSDNRLVESVLIPEKDHMTLCISSQVGCAQGCRFCATAKAGFGRQLAAGEILAQVREAARLVPQKRKLTNIVFMGMGSRWPTTPTCGWPWIS
jgi:23S rRNA (adenine2503-C2)-methyltransferase